MKFHFLTVVARGVVSSIYRGADFPHPAARSTLRSNVADNGIAPDGEQPRTDRRSGMR